MTIELMTLDELLAWWKERPNESAEPGNSQACLLAKPLMDRNVDVEISVEPTIENSPMDNEHPGWIKVWPNDDDEFTVPLPSVLNKLAHEFDVLPSDEYCNSDGVGADRIVKLIERIKQEVGA